MREYDVRVGCENVFAELLDLQASASLSPDFDVFEISELIERRYHELWSELTVEEEFSLEEMWRIQSRIERLNDLGFDVEEIDIVTDFDGDRIRIQPKVVELGHHDAIGVGVGDLVRGIDPHLVLPEGLLEGVVGEQAAHQGVAEAQQQLDGLDGLDRPDDAGQHAEHAGLGAAGGHLGRRRLGDHVPVGRAVQRVEHRDHALEPEDRAVDHGDAELHRRVVHQVAGGKVAGAVEDQVVLAEDLEDVVVLEALLVQHHVDERVDLVDRLPGRLRLRLADVALPVDDLALQVRLVDRVEVDDAQRADAGRRQVQQRRRAEPACPHHQRGCGERDYRQAFETREHHDEPAPGICGQTESIDRHSPSDGATMQRLALIRKATAAFAAGTGRGRSHRPTARTSACSCWHPHYGGIVAGRRTATFTHSCHIAS